MRLSTILVSAYAVTVSAAPAFPDFRIKDVTNPEDTLSALSDYFNVLATKVQLAKYLSQPPTCDVATAKMPTAPEALAPPSNGLQVSSVVIGRGTQNYTCDAGNVDAAPAAAGAVATLFDASCVAALYPDLLERIPGMALRFNLSDPEQLGASPLQPVGVHYFSAKTTPFFDIGQGVHVYSKKAADTPAPANAAKGQKGESAVAWLKLDAVEGTTGNVKEVYRVTTAGGAPPKTCENMPETFEVEYATAYWFWSGDIIESDE
jgi:hypothetical protein